MARGPKKHLKRLAAPRHWMLSKLGGTWAPRPSCGPHKLRECLPLILIIRNRLKYALTRRETLMVMMRRFIKVDGKVRTDMNFPAGFMDVISIEKTGETFRLLYDTKGRFTLVRIKPEEAKFKLLRVMATSRAKKATMGHNPFMTGQSKAIPYLVTHDGRTIRYPHPDIRVNDTVKFDLESQKVVERIKFDLGQVAMVTRGANRGRIGTIVHHDRHVADYDIIHLQDKRGNQFATRIHNVFIIGNGDKPIVAVPRDAGVYKTILEEREVRRLNAKK